MQKHLEVLRNKILDVSLRNPQINFKETKTSTIRLEQSSFEGFYDLIVNQRKKVDINAGNEKVFSADGNIGLRYQYDKIITDKNATELVNTMNRLRNRTKSAIEEIGLHPLYIVFGILNWFERSSKRMIKSPLLMIPVQFSKKNPKRFELSYTKDDIILNPTLVYKLEMEGISISSYDLFDHEGFSVVSFLERINGQKEMKEIKGSIDSEIHIGLFASSSLYMYKDLLDNESVIIQNEILNKLYGSTDPEIAFLEPEFVDPKYIDKNLNLETTHTVLESDSSQQVAILAAQQNMSFVLQGPPGTGKSQTITNIIADSIANNKKVLFVAEKKAALDVVFEKLREVGLEDFTLDLHSHGAKKDIVINNLIATVANRKEVDTKELPVILDELLGRKENVENYLNALTMNNEIINLNVFSLYGNILSLSKYPLLDYRFENIYTITPKTIKELTDQIDLYLRLVETIDYERVSKALYGFKSQNISQPEVFKNKFDRARETLNSNAARITVFLAELNEVLKISLPLTMSSLLVSDLLLMITHGENFSSYFGLKNYAKLVDALTMISSMKDELLHKNPNKKNELSTYVEKNFTHELGAFKGEYSKRLARIGRGYQTNKNSVNKYYQIEHLGHSEMIKELEIVVEIQNDYQRITGYIDEIRKVDSSFDISTNIEELIKTLGSFRSLSETLKKAEFKRVVSGIAKLNTQQLADIVATQTDLISKTSSSVAFLTKVFDHKKYQFIDVTIEQLLVRLNEASNNIELIDEYMDLTSQYDNIKQSGHKDLIKELEKYPQKSWVHMINKKYYSMWLDYIYFRNNDLNQLTKAKIQQDVENFKHYDVSYLSKTHLKIQQHLYQKFPNENDINVKMLEDESIKKRGQKSVRQIFDEIPDTIMQIKPCLLMSPLSVSTFLPPIVNMFDLVVFDEASQIIPENAVGSIYRGKQLIVVGDHEQLPPSYFFQQVTEEDVDNNDEVSITDQYESILDISRAHLSSKKLRWHYRSRHESLIRYSNAEIYKDLVLFPEAYKSIDTLGVRFEYVKEGYFEDRHNILEAERIAELVIEHIKKFPKRSLGIVSFSIKQQETIERQVNKIRRQHPQYESFFDEDRYEPFFIKNLENVQGDERDTIILSVCYAKSISGKLAYRFGPINQDVGYRRLNVATTRAKYNTIVVSSLLPEEIQRNEPRGVAFLKGYLDYAKNGSEIDKKQLKLRKPASKLEQDVYQYLLDLGYEVDLYINPFIQLAIKNPISKKYEIGIQIDGHNENKNYTLRDKYRNASSVLEGKEWQIYSIWSFEWFRNNKKSKDDLNTLLLKLFGHHPPKQEKIEKLMVEKKEIIIPTQVKTDKEKEKIINKNVVKTIQIEIEEEIENEERIYPYYVKNSKDLVKRNEIETADEYLLKFVVQTIKFESPIHKDVLFSRVAKLYGDKFLGKKLESQITQWIITWHIKKDYIFSKSIIYDLTCPVMFRIPSAKEDIRTIDQISDQELAMGIQIYLTKNLSSGQEEIRTDLASNLLIDNDDNLAVSFSRAMEILIKQKIAEMKNERLFLL